MVIFIDIQYLPFIANTHTNNNSHTLTRTMSYHIMSYRTYNKTRTSYNKLLTRTLHTVLTIRHVLTSHTYIPYRTFRTVHSIAYLQSGCESHFVRVNSVMQQKCSSSGTIKKRFNRAS